jgi:hypothetical protein
MSDKRDSRVFMRVSYESLRGRKTEWLYRQGIKDLGARVLVKAHDAVDAFAVCQSQSNQATRGRTSIQIDVGVVMAGKAEVLIETLQQQG